MDQIGHKDIPTGRFVSGVTETSIGKVRVIGVCIAWQMAHVTTGQKNSAPWEVHNAYLHGLKKMLARETKAMPTILIGDFNQLLPRGRQPIKAYEQLCEVIDNRFDIWTAGKVSGLDQQPVCHIGGTSDLKCERASGRTRYEKSGKQLTDHDGLVCQFNTAE